jgi:hypothetical protein
MMDIKLKVRPAFPVKIIEQNGIKLEKNAGKWTFALDYDAFDLRAPYVPQAGHMVAIFDGTAYKLVPVTSLAALIVTTPSPLTVLDDATIGTLVGTLAVIGGTGSYTFSLTSNPGGKYSITGNQLKVAAALTAGTDSITIQANNGAGSIITLNTTVTVVHHVTYVPTYHIYGF